MDEIEPLLEKYRAEIGQILDRKRSFENQAADLGQKAAVLQARIQGMVEAAEILRDARGVTRKRQRKLTGPWQKIMQGADLIGDFDYDDLETLAEDAGHTVGRDTLRSQMSGYKSSGLVESVGDGVFRLTDLGRQAAAIDDDDDDGSAPMEPNPPYDDASASWANRKFKQF